MNRITVYVWILAVLTLSGCAQFRSVSKESFGPGERVELTTELRDIYREVAMSTGRIRAVDGYADLYLSTPKRSAKAYCTVQLRKSKDARLIVTAGFLGWPVADMLIRPDSLFVNDMLHNRMLVGRNSGGNLEKIIGLDTGVGSMAETLFGIAEMAEPVSAIESVRQGDGKISYTVRSGDGFRVLVVDALSRSLAGMSFYDALGRRNVEFRFADYQLQRSPEGDLRVPREIDMLLYGINEPVSSRSLKVVYDERVINPPDFTIRYKWPKKAKTINLDTVERLPWM